jgi:diguanylate cyclase (GGDEF)-like protein/PAS domain S-box-containing protein
VWFKDNEGAHLIVNDEFCNVVKKTKQQVYKRRHNYIWDVPEDDYENGEAVCRRSEDIVVRARKTCRFEEKITTNDGMRQLVTYKSPLIDEDGEVFGTCGMGHDITDLKNIAIELRIIVDNIPMGIAILDKHGTVIAVNKFMEGFFPNASEIVGQNFDKWADSLDREELRSNQGDIEYRVFVNGEERVMHFRDEEIVDVFGENMGSLRLIRDITIQHHYLEQNVKYANTDSLTGLNNRRSLFKYLTSLKPNSKISFIMMDLDRFKAVNDTYGHAAGDEALEITSRVLEECFPDGFISRLGGDEFLVALVGENDLSRIEERTQQLLDTLLSRYAGKEEFKALSASAGIAQERLSVCDTTGIEDLIKRSDEALYTAKQSGKARYCVN